MTSTNGNGGSASGGEGLFRKPAPEGSRSDRPSDQRGRESAAPGKDAPATEGIFRHAAPSGAAKRMSEVLGEIVWLMSQPAIHKTFYIQDLEWPAAEAAIEPSR